MTANYDLNVWYKALGGERVSLNRPLVAMQIFSQPRHWMKTSCYLTTYVWYGGRLIADYAREWATYTLEALCWFSGCKINPKYFLLTRKCSEIVARNTHYTCECPNV